MTQNLYNYTVTQKHIESLIDRCTVTWTHRYTHAHHRTQVHRYTGTQVHRYTYLDGKADKQTRGANYVLHPSQFGWLD